MKEAPSEVFRIPMPSLQLLVLTMTWHSAVTESAASIQLRGMVGGNVVFHCAFDKKKTLAMLYLHKGETFVNGYHALGNISNQWNNTIVHPDKATILMYNLNVSHRGDYECYIRYNDKTQLEPIVHLHLDITANYSKPSLSVHCNYQNHPFSCLVQCTSHGGYPDSEVTWHIPGSSKVVNNSKMSYPDTKTFNISSTANVNCSDEKLTFLSCSVGNVSSDIVSVCTPEDPPDIPYAMISVAILAVAAFISALAFLWRWYRRRGQRTRKQPSMKTQRHLEG
ncbi:butyrophilin subfamily 1 member A1 [Clinocottus analis]|uniref:butyrophilin subfamily 1 member A1 n=1 Tax=Clinocottus analis TaxID=304258 RepID=UPI0035C193AC